MTEARTKRASGCLFGTAFGDALGFQTEFMTVDEILTEFAPSGPQEPQGSPALVTDDTQMAIALGEALIQAPKPYSAQTLEPVIREAFVRWSVSPENNRAPGNTCMTACHYLERGLPWQKATVMHSKGCGANMRVQAVGLLPDITPHSRAGIAQFQAALTHGHPTALAASDLTAKTITLLAAGALPADLPKQLREYALAQRRVYHDGWLGTLWAQTSFDSSEEYIASGWDECLGSLDALDEALAAGDRAGDPCQITGEGWIAEEALATALLCFLWFPEDPIAAIQRAVVSSGDSDSIACLTGAFAGTYCGLNAWPTDWVERIEYRERLAALGAAWDR